MSNMKMQPELQVNTEPPDTVNPAENRQAGHPGSCKPVPGDLSAGKCWRTVPS